MKVKVRVLDQPKNVNVPGWGQALQPVADAILCHINHIAPTAVIEHPEVKRVLAECADKIKALSL